MRVCMCVCMCACVRACVCVCFNCVPETGNSLDVKGFEHNVGFPPCFVDTTAVFVLSPAVKSTTRLCIVDMTAVFVLSPAVKSTRLCIVDMTAVLFCHQL